MLIEVKVDVAEKVITLPKLLLWYNSDFGGDAGETAVLRTISPMMTPTTSALSKQEESQGSNIEVYSTIGCKYCRIAKAKLLELGLTDWIDFNINIYDNKDSQETLSAISRERILHARQNTVPQIYFGLHRIGGCDELLGNYIKTSNNCKIFCVYNLTVYCSTLP